MVCEPSCPFLRRELARRNEFVKDFCSVDAPGEDLRNRNGYLVENRRPEQKLLPSRIHLGEDLLDEVFADDPIRTGQVANHAFGIP